MNQEKPLLPLCDSQNVQLVPFVRQILTIAEKEENILNLLADAVRRNDSVETFRLAELLVGHSLPDSSKTPELPE